MRILAFTTNNSGPGFHRIIMPLLMMQGVDVYITNNLDVSHFEKGVDILMYNRTLPEHSLPKIHELKEKYSFRICVDVDDYWHLDPHHLLYDDYQESEFARMQVEQIKSADIVLTTHSRLADEITPYNKNVHICPNAIPNSGQFDLIRKPHHLTRLFWQGSITHGEDIALLRWPIDKLAPIADKIKMVMGGYTDGEPEWHRMAMDYTAGLKHQYQLLPGLHVNEYYKHYEQADICLIPLLNSPFNKMKSNLKVLEAANLSLPVIASHVHPYLDMPILYAKNTGDWVRHITKLVASKKRQKEAGAELKEFCDKYYNFQKINNERRQIFEYQHVRA
jgi:glycosyltransferase involved in cell wall biosynthesis